MKTITFIGRWQCNPPHKGHIELVQTALDKGFRAVIGIRDTVQDENNPYSYLERELMWLNTGLNIEVIRIPDYDCDLEVWIGRRVGYKVVRLDKDIEDISGMEIRALFQ